MRAEINKPNGEKVNRIKLNIRAVSLMKKINKTYPQLFRSRGK